MTISEAQLSELLRLLDEGRQSWIEGKLGFGRGFEVDQDDDMTLFGPFGGSAIRGTGQLEGSQNRAESLFGGGTGQCEVIKTFVGGDVVTVVQVERNQARVAGSTEPQAWVLRTTQVFELRDGRWARLHRHADPLIDFRAPPATFALARGQDPPQSS